MDPQLYKHGIKIGIEKNSILHHFTSYESHSNSSTPMISCFRMYVFQNRNPNPDMMPPFKFGKGWLRG